MPVALDRRVAYFAAETLSDNVALSPEGYLICKDVVIGRTGFQTYKVSEIDDPEGLLAGWDYKPDEEIELWRDPSEVFSPATIASFEGKTFTLTHPKELLDPTTERENFIGHVQNVRRGSESLGDGNIPLRADVIIKVDEGIDAYRRGMREISSGYGYTLAREGYRWDQRKIVGNHVALVDKGRAGAEARINDAAAESKETTMSFLEKIWAHGWKAFAAEAKPEDLVLALKEKEDSTRSAALDASNVTRIDAGKREPKFVSIGKTSDGVEIFRMSVARDDDKSGKDDGKEEENKAAMDKRKRMHDTLDKMFDATEEEMKKRSEEEDADVKSLMDMLGKMTKGGDDSAKDAAEKEKEEAEKKAAEDAETHPEGCRCADCMDKRKGKDAEKKEEEGVDDAEIVRAEPVLAEGERPKSVFDAAMTMDLMKGLRTVIAKSDDAKVKKAFDAVYQGLRAAVKKVDGAGSYREVGRAAATLSDSAKDSVENYVPKETAQQKQQRENDAIYAEAGKKSRERSLSVAMRK